MHKIIYFLIFISSTVNAEFVKNTECLKFSVYSGLANYSTGYSDKLVSFNDKGVIFYKKNERYSPLLISRWGFSSLVSYCDNNNKDALKASLSQAEYLISTAKIENNFITWPFYYNGGGNASGYSSSISNAAIIDLLLHVGFITNNKEFIKYAKLGANSFLKTIEEGGVIYKMPEEKGFFFEEYATEEAKVKHIFNGHILALMHLSSYINNYLAIYKEDEHIIDIKKSFNNGVKSVFYYMNMFDAKTKKYGRTTYYDLGKISVKSAEKYPHRIHICGLYWLYNLTKKEDFFNLAKKWNGYRKKEIGCIKEKKKAFINFKNNE